jgi:hypothetical protein
MERGSVGKRKSDAGGQLARDKVLAVAADVFYRKGIRAVGVEEIVKEAGVAKIWLSPISRTGTPNFGANGMRPLPDMRGTRMPSWMRS